jgi:fermentation-respiration switch protein FrsA (DUF1100 family)
MIKTATLTAAKATTAKLTTETIVGCGYATLAGARKSARTADKAYYAGCTLDVRVRANAEWARIGIDKAEYVVVAL